jgi:hypothetical protein
MSWLLFFGNLFKFAPGGINPPCAKVLPQAKRLYAPLGARPRRGVIKAMTMSWLLFFGNLFKFAPGGINPPVYISGWNQSARLYLRVESIHPFTFLLQRRTIHPL